ncbi:very-short-patch-repair endonuclease [Novosphingobium hassiacum]|uniref:Very-short-patch-repair endonuclease n=2 Tax=Novosphingobium hassiacum TaxID=173676 RepID=A0A7W5ZSB7_9SPHN|nr:DUF559 domain-containing protein [Novosphingobium hassiacum]MBB3859103.1 very-short-patch-repair endonuclease [Novosphingobium hassiacum]
MELDGGQHTQTTDAARTAIIEREGYRVPRFWNTEVLANPEGVHTRLTEALAQPSSPSNSG